MKYIELHTDGVIVIRETTQESAVVDYETLRSLIEALPDPIGWFEIVRVRAGGHKYMMIVDEEGLLTGKEYNPAASALYGQTPSDFIVGDALVLSDHGDEDMYFLTDEEVKALFLSI